QNTDKTTKQLLGFSIDWKKLCDFLKNNWKCEKVFLYIGVDERDLETIKMLEELKNSGFIIREKTTFSYKNKDKEINISCPKCGNKFIEKIDMGYNKKANCDVDLTVDAMDLAKPNSVFYLFTGDGDFEFLIKNIVLKGVKVYIVSSARKIRISKRYSVSRLSKKLRNLVIKNPDKIYLIEINNLKMKFQKN
ncbi:MAG: NYN domain-containing protein, partial [bacterium]|nr:NYN domain-containing protein [bacterium]